MRYHYTTFDTCSTAIDFDLENGIVHNVVFTNGCDGNLKAIPKLIDGWKAADVVAKLKGNDCGGRGTSCADQLARALEEALAKEKAA
jgi:uncharacterized protein (TIGR03905 family)